VTRTGRTVRIGITGPIGCGKSQVSRWLAELGVAVIDADAVARAVTSPGHPAHDLVLRRFGPAVTAPDGTLDRAALGRVVFSSPALLRELEQIVHPAVRPRILSEIEAAERAGAPAVALEVIKLVEGGLSTLCDEVWVVTCSAAVQRERLLARGMSEADADQRMAAQTGLVDRLRPAATWILDTIAPAAETRAKVVERLGDVIVASR
jgi:dephospho-CoA kinase